MTNKEAIEILKGIYPVAYSPTEEQRIEAINMAISALTTTPEEPTSESKQIESEYVQCNIEIFNKKWPILPKLRGDKLHEFKNFLNTCQQTFGLKYWGMHPKQAILFEKLTLLWATWGAYHLKYINQPINKKDSDIKMEEPIGADLEEEVHNYRMQHGYPEDEDELFSFAYHFADWQLQSMVEALRAEYEKGRYDMLEKMMQVSVNLNDYVFVEVTEYGWERADEHHRDVCNDAEYGMRYVDMMKSHTKDYMTAVGKRRLTAMQFHEFMNTFGHLACCGGQNFIKNNEVFFEFQVKKKLMRNN